MSIQQPQEGGLGVRQTYRMFVFLTFIKICWLILQKRLRLKINIYIKYVNTSYYRDFFSYKPLSVLYQPINCKHPFIIWSLILVSKYTITKQFSKEINNICIGVQLRELYMHAGARNLHVQLKAWWEMISAGFSK